MYINTAEQISGIPSSWPGYDLTIGSRGDKVRQIQQQLNRIAKDYPSLPTIAVDGVYGESTANAVRKFQNILDCHRLGLLITLLGIRSVRSMLGLVGLRS